MSELPVDEWVWAEGIRLVCGCVWSSWVRTSEPGVTAEDVMNRGGSFLSSPQHPHEHVELCATHVGRPEHTDWLGGLPEA